MDSTPEDEKQEVSVRRLGENGNSAAVFEFEGQLRDAMIASLREGFLTRGNYTTDAKSVSSQAAAALAVTTGAGASTIASSAASSSLYMATADPATLMKLGQGVGSAVMGPTGIVKHAPFVPVASSLPLLAPLAIMQVMSTAAIMQQFKQVDQKLDSIKRTLDKTLARIEATHAGELLAASTTVDEVYEQYDREGQFSPDMLMRLALAERDAKALSMRFRQLVTARDSTNVRDLDEVQQSNYDAHSAMLASFIELRVAYLRVCVDMQENPRSVSASTERLKTVIDEGLVFWQQLQDRSRSLKGEILELESKLKDMNWATRNLPLGGASSIEKALTKHNAAYRATIESEREIMSEFHSFIDAARAARKALDEPSPEKSSATVVYWRDETGEHSFVTEQRLIDPDAA